MKHFLLKIIVPLLLVSNVSAQEEHFTYCQKVPSWDDFVIDSSNNISGADILIVTNRPYLRDEAIFLPNDIAKWRLVSYFTAQCKDSTWYLSEVADFNEGMDCINDGSDVALFVHGHGKTFPSALVRASQIEKRYAVKTILFDWPSHNGNFNKSLARVRRCGENFYNTLLQLEAYKKSSFHTDQHLSVFAHSLGNYFLTHLVVNGNSQYLQNVFVDNIVVNAAAVKSKNHFDVLSRLYFQKNIYVTLNENDRVLRGAHLATYGKMLGNFAVPPLASNAEYLHFTPLVDKQHTYFGGYHQFEYTNAGLFYFYNTALHGDSVLFSNKAYFTTRAEENSFDIKAYE